MAMALQITIAAMTHSGPVREANEDRVAVGQWTGGGDMQRPYCVTLPADRPVLLLVCDGMGGHRGGEVASRTAVEVLRQLFDQDPDTFDIGASVNAASTCLNDAGRANADLRGMGTTVAGLIMGGTEPRWFNVGDSGVYRRTDAILKLSHDDVPEGPRSGRLTQALGGTAEPRAVEPHTGPIYLRQGTVFLLCSDGLTDVMDYREIEQVLAGEPEAAAAQLVESVIARQGSDNVSVIVAKVGEMQDEGGLDGPQDEA